MTDDGQAILVGRGEEREKLDACLQEMAALYGSPDGLDYSVECPRKDQQDCDTRSKIFRSTYKTE